MSVSFLASYTKNNKETPVEMMAVQCRQCTYEELWMTSWWGHLV